MEQIRRAAGHSWVRNIGHEFDTGTGTVTTNVTLATERRVYRTIQHYGATTIDHALTETSITYTMGYYNGQGITVGGTAFGPGPHRWVDEHGNMVDLNTYVDLAGTSMGAAYGSPPSKEALLKQRIERQLRPEKVFNHRGRTRRAEAVGADFSNVSKPEIVALHLLRKMVDSDTFRKYLRTGVLSVRGASGLYYAVGRKDHLVNVFYNGKKVATLCVYVSMKYNCPPTDEVITKKVMIEFDEPDIWRQANWHVSPKELEEIRHKKSEVTAGVLLRLVA